MRLEIKAAARADLFDIADYITRDNPERAESFIDELIARMTVIGERPFSFATRGDAETGLRAANHGRYLIIFRVTGELVEILRVVHGARDIDSLL